VPAKVCEATNPGAIKEDKMQQRFLVLSALMSALWLGSSGVSLAEPATKAQPAQPAQPKLGQAATPATPAIPATPASPEAPAFG